MAWSDAARAAAAAARKAHAKSVKMGRHRNALIGKSMYHFRDPNESTYQRYPRNFYDRMTGRQKIASELRAIRSGEPTRSGLSPARLAQVAALSTKYRNMTRPPQFGIVGRQSGAGQIDKPPATAIKKASMQLGSGAVSKGGARYLKYWNRRGK